VHPVKSEYELGVRLGSGLYIASGSSKQNGSKKLTSSGRRVFGLFHPKLPDCPLVVLYVILADASNLPRQIEEVLSKRVSIDESLASKWHFH
jgi:hypothetical protein